MKRFAAFVLLCLSLAGCFYACCEEGGSFSQVIIEAAQDAAEQAEQPELTKEEELALYQQNRDEIYRFITDVLELNHAAACGIIANIHYESRFNPQALGDYGTSYGLCQWHNRRFRYLVSWCEENGYDFTTVEGQLYYMKSELEGYYSFVYEHLKSVANTSRGAYSAGNYWCLYYEKPKNKIVSGDLRGELARQRYWHILKDTDK